MERQIEIIAPKPKARFLTNGMELHPNQKRVAAYCRVSTDTDDQLNSFENQVSEWKQRLENDPNVILVDIYCDEGISGTSLEGRVGFQKMIRDAKKGLIDKIVTKSISRFARNIQTSIDVARELKEIGVEIYFDNEHISTLDPSSEVLFALCAIMAQEESRHISDNVKWTFRRNKKEGIPMVSVNLLGYRRDPDNPKNLIIVPEEAEIVKLIFKLYVDEVGTNEICRILEQKGYLTSRGKTKWYGTTINGVITNEKYCGDLLLQKSVTVDFLNHKRIKNNGIEEQVYIKNNHEPIVDRDTWNRAQIIMKKNRDRFRGENKDSRKYASKYPLSGMLVCIHCGNTYKRRHFIQGYPEPRIAFQCAGYMDGPKGHRCPTKSISEDILLEASCEVINRIYLSKSNISKTIIEHLNTYCNTTGIQESINRLTDKQKTIDSEIDEIIKKKQMTTDDVEKIVLDRQYKERINEYQVLEKEINALHQKEQDIEYAKYRFKKMSELLNGESITPKTLTKTIMQTCIQSIIVIDKQEIVFVIPSEEKANYLTIKERRHELIKNPPIIEGKVILPRKFRTEKLIYKVVMM